MTRPQVEDAEKETSGAILREVAVAAKLTDMQRTLETQIMETKKLEGELKGSLSPKEAFAMMEKGKEPIRAHANMLKTQVDSATDAKEAAIMREAKVAAILRDTKQRTAKLEEQLKASMSKKAVDILLEKTKQPLRDYMHVLQTETKAKTDQLEIELRTANLRTADMDRQNEALQEMTRAMDAKLKSMANYASPADAAAMMQRAKAPLISQMHMMQEETLAKLEALEQSMTVKHTSGLARVKAQLLAQNKELEAQLAKYVSPEDMAVMLQRMKQPLVAHMQMLREETEAEKERIRSEMAAKGSAELASLRSSMGARIYELEKQLAVSVSQSKVSEMLEEAKAPLRSHMHLMKRDMAEKVIP